ncbi:hypothetical protein ECANGB1_2649 [Enterospora canceri]|uniref:Uncharacterized protein n=1 Tax=Enterospora canceri TaxID=1081671 RepID=A0A1Y1S738_9MICR|nr:hypothetical protein ECANGB1_2649 [Enterospora canceri]
MHFVSLFEVVAATEHCVALVSECDMVVVPVGCKQMMIYVDGPDRMMVQEKCAETGKWGEFMPIGSLGSGGAVEAPQPDLSSQWSEVRAEQGRMAQEPVQPETTVGAAECGANAGVVSAVAGEGAEAGETGQNGNGAETSKNGSTAGGSTTSTTSKSSTKSSSKSKSNGTVTTLGLSTVAAIVLFTLLE